MKHKLNFAVKKELIFLYFKVLLILAGFLLVWVCIHEGMHALFCIMPGGNIVGVDINWKLPSVHCNDLPNYYSAFIYAICPYLLNILLLAVLLNLHSNRLWFRIIPYALGFELFGNFIAFIISGESDFSTIKNTLPGNYFWLAMLVVLAGFYVFGNIIYRDYKAVNWKKLLKH